MTDAPAVAAALAYRDLHARTIIAEFLDLLALDNITGDVPALETNAAELVPVTLLRGVFGGEHPDDDGRTSGELFGADRRAPGLAR